MMSCLSPQCCEWVTADPLNISVVQLLLSMKKHQKVGATFKIATHEGKCSSQSNTKFFTN